MVTQHDNRACQLLSRRTEIDRERELNTLCTMLLNEKTKLEKMKSALAHTSSNNIILLTLYCR